MESIADNFEIENPFSSQLRKYSLVVFTMIIRIFVNEGRRRCVSTIIFYCLIQKLRCAIPIKANSFSKLIII